MEHLTIPFNKPHFTGNETRYIEEAVKSGRISGDGVFSQRCHRYFEERYGFKRCMLTTSCTDALEMAAILLDIAPGDEVIMPSFTFVSTANAFLLRGAKIVFCDSLKDHPGMDEDLIADLITPKTKVIVPVHYAGVSCDMHKIMQLAEREGIFVVEDAAQAIDSFYTFPDGSRKALGGIGHLAAFSFHETKNVQCGEGGMLVINDARFVERAEIIREKGTDRSKFFRGEIDKYGWVDIGSSFLPSDVNAAFLWAQLENLNDIQDKRKQIWHAYHIALAGLQERGLLHLPVIPEFASNNAHMFYVSFDTPHKQQHVLTQLKDSGVHAVFHYQSLHKSTYFQAKHDGRILPMSDHYSHCLIRLPFFYALQPMQQVVIDALLAAVSS